ncbi:hypothetical protein K6H09_004853 [Candida tropicalis]
MNPSSIWFNAVQLCLQGAFIAQLEFYSQEFVAYSSKGNSMLQIPIEYKQNYHQEGTHHGSMLLDFTSIDVKSVNCYNQDAFNSDRVIPDTITRSSIERPSISLTKYHDQKYNLSDGYLCDTTENETTTDYGPTPTPTPNY